MPATLSPSLSPHLSSDVLSPILRLPPELIDHLLTLVPPSLLQLTALSLLKVFPEHNISKRHLWRHIVIYRAGQLMPLWKKLKEDEAMRVGARTFALQSWQGDADILNNVMRRLDNINTLMLNIGTNFAPEHLQEMFGGPRMKLERMELRFRPYVEQASYYQFLAGSYFDTAIETLTRQWPVCPNFTHISIIQDLPPRSTAPNTARNSATSSLANSFADLRMADTAAASTAPSSDSEEASGVSTPPTSVDDPDPNPTDAGRSKAYTGHGPFGNPFLNEKLGITRPKHFAQPIVFFDIQCLAHFGAAPVAANLTHLRLRVPSRDLAKVLIMPPPRGSYNQVLFPELRYLDISTTNVRLDTTLSALLKQYSKLEHLVLDRVNLFGFTAREKGLELCNDLGMVIVNAGLTRSKEKERQIAAWEVAERVRMAEAAAEAARQVEARQRQQEDHQGDRETEEDRRAREAQEEIQRNLELMRSRRGHRSAAHSTFSLRDRRRTGTSTSTASSSANNLPLPPQDKLYMVLPPLPTLKTISIGGEAHTLPASKVAQWENQFHAGWMEGLERILGWATHLADKYDRGKRKAEEWVVKERRKNGDGSNSTTGAGGSSIAKGKGKGKTSSSSSSATAAKALPKPPTDIRLFRFPLPSETVSCPNNEGEGENCVTEHEKPGPFNLTAGLIEVIPSSPSDRSYLNPYREALADAQLYKDRQEGVGAPCVFCTIPDCEGPARRGAEGEKVDGRGGMGGKHREGCGHMVGRRTWGWEGF
ncbi:hypothetical protein C349_06949 [Cryptococcus neoformans var. grubii Br795]|nr:hypothetical protein C353_06868 [Cryptococcus neoformans var. grubii AD1-83a]OWZ49947.1 hypothetical protein C368_06873 [Cryptococcus neoformans var. grubii 125.91]OXG41163.1 hypothetical protein C355_06864 [Cryptococcus neoformans var. grubii Th84]OXG43582.1 hypothetical protein C354_06847 [Cryptococcus neoformans var. grubii MW-RSA1955]OXG47583.1 hypothetical protein C352_06869 [Cryptococcus neoformans var. grubii CHC193]OXG56507.1 hypothetical protein C351_06845 [Cryptococcus neoformans 